MKGCCEDMGEMEGMMMEMMPECLGMMLAKLPQEQRTEMVKKLFAVLLEKGGAGMTEEDKEDLVYKIMGTAKV